MTPISAELPPREGGSRIGFRVMRWIALHAPDWVSDGLASLIALSYAARPGRMENAASDAYLARVFARPARLGERIAHARAFALVFVDRVRLLSAGTEGFRVEGENAHIVEELVAEGRGAVLLGAHFGSFEAMRAFERQLPGLRVHYMMHPEGAAMSSDILAELNAEVAGRVIHLSRGPGALIAATEALAGGAHVGFLGDRVGRQTDRATATVPFLDGHIRVPLAPYLTAMAAHVPIVLCFAPRIGRRHYAIRFTQLHDGSAVPRKDRQRIASALARDYAAELEAVCRAHPYNWFNFLDLWSDERGDLRGIAT